MVVEAAVSTPIYPGVIMRAWDYFDRVNRPGYFKRLIALDRIRHQPFFGEYIPDCKDVIKINKPKRYQSDH